MKNVKPQNKLRWLLLLTLLTWELISLVGCAYAKIIGSPPDVDFCANLGDHGYCRFIVSHKSYFVDDGSGHSYKDLDGTMKKAQLYVDPVGGKSYTWNQVLQTAVISPANSFAQLKAWADNVCHQMKCKNGVGSWSDFSNDLGSHVMSPSASTPKQ